MNRDTYRQLSRKLDESGFGILEFSILFMLTSTLIFGVWGLVSMLQAQRALEYRTDKVFYEQTISIWNMGADLKLNLNTSQMEMYLETEAEKLYSSVSNLNALTPGKAAFIELAIARLDIDETTGAPIGRPTIVKVERRGSSTFISAEIDAVANFDNLFAKFDLTTSNGVLLLNGVSLWAVPYSKGGVSMNFRDSAFFIAARVFVEADGFAAWFKNIIGFEPVYFISRAYALRGDVEL